MKKQIIPFDLLAKYYTGQASAREEKDILSWKRKNEDLFRKLRHQWVEARPDFSLFVEPDENKVWEKIEDGIRQRGIQPVSYSRNLLIRVAVIAASVALLIGFGFSHFLKKDYIKLDAESYKNTIVAPPGQKTHLELPDGTQLWLNSGSRLTYTYQYNQSERTVNLEGEAYFEVIYDKKLPFVVKTECIDVEVHGTTFNVRAYRDEPDVSVSLVTGSVSLNRASDHQCLTFLQPNESAVYSKETQTYHITWFDPDILTSWHLNKLKFDGADSEELWKKLERWYGVKISLSNVQPDNLYWFSIKTESLTEILEVIHKITPIEYELNGEEVKIRYK